MNQPIERDRIYRGRRFQTETIELCVRWYITYRLSYRDLAAMMAESGIIVSHTTIMRWVLRYVPEYEKRWAHYARPVDSSWRMDETAIRVRGKSAYLYRAVDKHGKSVDSLLREDRGIEARRLFSARRLLPNSRRGQGRSLSMGMPRVISQFEDFATKTADGNRCAYAAATTLAGIELAHRINKGQLYFGAKRSNRL